MTNDIHDPELGGGLKYLHSSSDVDDNTLKAESQCLNLIVSVQIQQCVGLQNKHRKMCHMKTLSV